MNELITISKINQDIKDIVSMAENISLTAADAMLVAKQAGADAVGFNMVALELRMYSEKMNHAMQTLSKLIYWQVEINASKRQRLRKLDLLSKTGSYGALAEARITPACARGLTDLDEIEQLIVKQVRELQRTIKRTAKQCATGLMIARSAGIEAAHGGEMTPVLRQIANDVEQVVGTISIRVDQLESQLAEIGL